MMRTRFTWSLAALGACAPALAQVGGKVTWFWEVTTQSGDTIVGPGETATVTLSINMEPDVNFPDGPVLGFGAAEFDTLAGLHASNGTITGWTVLNSLDNLMGDQTTTDGQSLFGTLVGQSPIGGPWTPDDPIAVLQLEWKPAFFGDYAVKFATSTTNPQDGTPMQVIVWEGDGVQVFEDVEWPISEANVYFAVVPSPVTIATLCSLAWLLPNRRRR